jgi:hypothetical protein
MRGNIKTGEPLLDNQIEGSRDFPRLETQRVKLDNGFLAHDGQALYGNQVDVYQLQP